MELNPDMTRARIVVGHRVFPDTIEYLREQGDVIYPVDADSLPPEVLRHELSLADAWMAFMPDSANEQLLQDCPRLRLIAGALKGCDNFDVSACTRHGTWVSVVPDLLSVPTAELTIALMIGLARHVREGDQCIRSGSYSGWRPSLYGTGFAGRRVGFIGMGVIGQAVARRLVPFEVEQRYFDPKPLGPELEASLQLSRIADMKALLQWSDYLVLAASLTPGTLHIVGREALQQVRPGCLLINPSRGSLVDESAVIAALNEQRLGGYAADVFEMEDWARPDRPREIAQELRNHRRTLFTPHLGSAVTDVRRAIERRAADNILDALSGRVPRDAVNAQARVVSGA
jgi:phosphonate dehydrogenase